MARSEEIVEGTDVVNQHSRKIAAWVLVMALFSGILSGCSNSKAVSAKVDEKLELAVKYLSEQKFEEAILTYQEVIKLDSKNVTAYKGLSLAFVLQDKPDEALKALQNGLTALPQNTAMQLAKAGVMLDKGDASQAEAIYKELINSGTPSISTYQAYAHYLDQAGRQVEAISLLEQASSKNAQDYQLSVLLAESYMKHGDRDKALTAVIQSITVEPNQAAAYTLLADLYQNNWEEIIKIGQQYYLQNQTRTGQLVILSGLLGMGQYENITRLYGEFAADIRDTAKVRFLAAQAYAKLGQHEKAVELLKPAIDAGLKDAGLLADIANYYLDRGDKESARLFALQGVGIDETVIKNYAVLYRSYLDADKAMAQIWAVKYLLASSLSLQAGLAQFAKYGMEAGFLRQAKGEVNPQKIVGLIVRDQTYAQKMLQSQPNLPTMTSAIYLDTRNNIAYRGVSEKSSGWKPYIVRYHSPALCSAATLPAHIVANIDRSYPGGWSGLQQHWQSENPQGITKYLPIHSGMPQGENNWVLPVVREDNIPLEDYLKSAGYPIENITFLDM